MTVGQNQLRNVVEEPKSGAYVEVVGEKNDSGPRYPSALRKTLCLVFPMMHGQYAENCVKGTASERQGFGTGSNYGGGTWGTLRDHRAGRFDCENGSGTWFVRASPCAHV